MVGVRDYLLELIGRVELPAGFALSLGEDEGQQLADWSLNLPRTCKPFDWLDEFSLLAVGEFVTVRWVCLTRAFV
jgi:hypothetical protein